MQVLTSKICSNPSLGQGTYALLGGISWIVSTKHLLNYNKIGAEIPLPRAHFTRGVHFVIDTAIGYKDDFVAYMGELVYEYAHIDTCKKGLMRQCPVFDCHYGSHVVLAGPTLIWNKKDVFLQLSFQAPLFQHLIGHSDTHTESSIHTECHSIKYRASALLEVHF